MRERPIIFSGPMVKAIREKRKIQTRRVLTVQPELVDGRGKWRIPLKGWPIVATAEVEQYLLPLCPYGRVGDHLWVRESFCPVRHGSYEWIKSIPRSAQEAFIQYRADYVGGSSVDYDGHWKPAIHMPRWVCRVLLEIAEIRVQRVQQISEEDAKAEGMQAVISQKINGWTPCVLEYSLLWDSINAKRDGGRFSWEKNPWVWAVSFLEIANS